jgi:hypothetical protein
MPVTVPNTLEVNFTPSSAEETSPESDIGGVTPAPQIVQGQDTFTAMTGPGASRMPL